MNLEKVKIVADSSCDIKELKQVAFESAPLKIITAEKEYVDDENLDVYGMVTDLRAYSGKSKTSCPNVGDWLAAFGDAEYVFVYTITATLSGAYNAAMIAKREYEEKYPERRVFVMNTLSTGAEMALLMEKTEELILAGKEFDEICETVTAYGQKTGLLFLLESMKNLANNGRVSPIVAKMAGLLGIRLLGKASDVGDIEPVSKCRGEKNAIETTFAQMKALGFGGGKVRITHSFNENAANSLKALITAEFPNVDVTVYALGGLTSFYAEKGGLIVGFEKV